MLPKISYASFASLLLFVASSLGAQEPELDLSQYFGFQPLEIFNLEMRSGSMLAGDFNHDRLNDLAIVDNSHSRIDLLLQRTQRPQTPDAPRGINAITYDWRFEHKKIPVDKQIASMAAGDFDHDGRRDLAYFGLPDQLVVRYQPESGDWNRRFRLRLPDVVPSQWILISGDINSDGRDDLVVVGKSVTYVIAQDDAGKFHAPLRLMNTSNKLALAQVADLNGDGRNDIGYMSGELEGETQFFCARLQTSSGKLGPELQFEIKKPRALTLANIDGKPGHEVLTVESRTGRVSAQQFEQPSAQPGQLAGRLTHYGLGTDGSTRDRDIALGDLDGDGLTDVLVSDPELARILVFRQWKTDGLDLGQPFPALIDTRTLRAADLDGDGAAEVYALSEKEKTIGRSRMRDGRLTFPEPLPIVGEPATLELTDLDNDGHAEVIYISRIREGRRSSYSLRALQLQRGSWSNYRFGKEESVKLSLSGAPESIVGLDANADGRTDLLLVPGRDREPELLVGAPDGALTPVVSRAGIQLGGVESGSVFVGELDGPAVLVAQERFARKVRLTKDLNWQVVDQFNVAETAAQISGVSALDLDGQPGRELVLIDTGVGKLRVLRKDGALYQPWAEVDTGRIPFRSAHVADLNGDKTDDLLLFSGGRFSVLYSQLSSPMLTELASFETKLENAYPSDVVAGDLNDDGHIDLALFDAKSHHVEILDLDPKQGLRHGISFKLFESKSFSRNPNVTGTEPREAVIADLTNDGLPDLVILAHDRILLFPQDRGKP